MHADEQRGQHYHVTSGEFPHIIGGYWGVAEAKNRRSGPGGRSEVARPPMGRLLDTVHYHGPDSDAGALARHRILAKRLRAGDEA